MPRDVTPHPSPRSHIDRWRRWMVAAVVGATSFAVVRWQLPSDNAEQRLEVTTATAAEPRPVPSRRGRILDRTGAPLADSRRVSDVNAVPGRTEYQWSREYPHGALAAHLIGYLEPGNDRTPGGEYGIERAYDRLLRAPTSELTPPTDEPAAGHDVVLTIDLRTQKLVENALAKHAAAAVAVVEVDTGRILALASTPAFDPNQMSGQSARAERERLSRDPRNPLLDRTLERAYPPASTYKLVTAVAGLESHEAPLDEHVTCKGERTVGDIVMRDMLVHGSVDFIEALQVSCNIYFWQIGERVGVDRMTQVARDFGFGSPSGLGLNGDAAGHAADGRHDERLLTALNTAIGDGEVAATVVQVAMAYVALANGGKLYEPQIVRRVQRADGQVVTENEPVVRRRIGASAATLRLIRKGMQRAVNVRRGTAYDVRKGAVKMAGKTGTAPSRDKAPANAAAGWDPTSPHAWFVGWAPARRPRIVVAVLIEHGGAGGPVAAPVARTIVDGYFARSRPRPRKRSRH